MMFSSRCLPSSLLLTVVSAAAMAQPSTFGNTTGVSDSSHLQLWLQGTNVIDSLNAQIGKSAKGVYQGGKGIFVHTPDFFANGGELVVPVSFWVNDIIAPNQLYPGGKQVGNNPAAGNPWCPHGGSDGFQNIGWSKCDLPNGPWSYATVAAVIGEGGMKQIYSGTFDQIQTPTWGWGVFYAYDANAIDKRCRNLDTYKGFDCPGTWIPYQGSPKADRTKKGAGFYKPGNPYASGGGGGAGCHFDVGLKKIDQTDAWSGTENIVGDSDCQCNYKAFNKDWNKWVDSWMLNTKQKPGFEKRSWLKGGGGRAPAWGLDTAICWVNNPRDMILMQNALWLKHAQWLNGEAPQWGVGQNPIPYWGWNEVPADREIVMKPEWWDAVMIKLPVDKPSISSMGKTEQQQLEQDLATWHTQGKIVPGFQHCSNRPGSYIVIAREMKSSTNVYDHLFYCEDWISPRGWYKIVYVPRVGKSNTGACYIEKIGNAHSDVVV